MIEDPCPHDGDPHSCPPCQRKAGRIKDERPESLYSFVARYPGDCSVCHLPIMAGQGAVKWSDDRVTHERCHR